MPSASTGPGEAGERAGAAPHRQLPLALIEAGRHGLRIAAVNGAAAAEAVRIGQRLSDARAVCPGLVTHPADPAADAAWLENLGHWAMRYAPLVALTPPDGLMLDTTGSDHLFGGEAAMVRDITGRLATMGFTARAALAPTPAAAWGCARFAAPGMDNRIAHAPPPRPSPARGEGEECAPRRRQGGTSSPFPVRGGGASGQGAEALSDAAVIVTEDDMPHRLDRLPVAALRLDPDRVLLLARLGLKTVGQIRAVPRAALERRFRSKDLYRAAMLRLDQMTGVLGEPQAWLSPPVRFRRTVAFAEPALDLAGLEAALDHLLAGLAADLARAGQGARAFTFTACHADGRASTAGIALSRPGRDAAAIRPLFAGKLDAIDPGFGIDGAILSASRTEPVGGGQSVLAAGAQAVLADAGPVIDRLVNRLGPERMTRRAPRSSHVPERAERPAAPEAMPIWPVPAPDTPARPFRLLERPEAIAAIAEVPDGPPLRFVWRRVTRQVVRAQGPERIAPEWWDNGTGDYDTRDYYQVEDTTGHRYWVYREGLYQDPARRSPPRWFLHGFFG